jgi:hypothetical protein
MRKAYIRWHLRRYGHEPQWGNGETMVGSGVQLAYDLELELKRIADTSTGGT